ncbi:MAG: RHS repeat-associated core domain-containing protein [Sandaracinaceae bacterium]|nr:RHS repeat-associated core domain-containing protein [Sandaracinaceae bacterium]
MRIERARIVIARYDYDAGGRVTRIERDGRAQRLVYDADDHVVQVEDELSGDGARFAFDAQGRRVAREERVAGATTRSLDWAVGPTLVQSLESPHAVGDGSGELGGYVFDGEHPMARFDAAGAPVYYLRDAMGSVIGLVDAAGVSSSRIHYDGFGNVLREDGALAALPASLGGDFRFQGMWQDPGSGWYYVRARTYEPQTGRFTSRDPESGAQAQPESFGPYRFAASNPYEFADPTGRTEGLVGQSVAVSASFTLASVSAATWIKVGLVGGTLLGGAVVGVGMAESMPSLVSETLAASTALTVAAAEVIAITRVQEPQDFNPRGCTLVFEVSTAGVPRGPGNSGDLRGLVPRSATPIRLAGYICLSHGRWDSVPILRPSVSYVLSVYSGSAPFPSFVREPRQIPGALFGFF